MGLAIMAGIMDSLRDLKANPSSSSDTPSRLPSTFNACVRSSKSAKRIRDETSQYQASLKIYENDNLPAVQAADIVLLGCKPYMVRDVLSADGIKEALKGKLLLSVLAGVPEEQIEDILYPGQSHKEILEAGGCTVVRAMPNTASKVRSGMTVINIQTPPLEKEQSELVTWMFERIGKVAHMPPANMDACTALCGSGPAFMAIILEAMADGGVAMGIPRAEAQMMAAQVRRGTSEMVLSGLHPGVMKDQISSPGGCTIGGLMVLEEGAVRGHVARAVREATVVASQLGHGVKNVNGPRH